MVGHQISIKAIFLLREPRTGHTRGLRALTTAGSGPMLRTDRVGRKISHHQMIVVPELGGSVDALLDICILA